MTARVDFVIACHTPTRPIGKAVASVLEGNGDDVNLIVVCHNVDVALIENEIEARHRSRIKFLHLEDGIRSASGPFELGMNSGNAEFVSIMGSDDTLEPGAVRTWLDLADSTDAEVVITRLKLEGRPVHTPPTRPSYSGLADPVRDRLSYRSAPLGLVSAEARKRLGAHLVPEVLVGDDVPYVTHLWFNTRVTVQRTGPSYVIGESATDRMTYESRSLGDEFRFIEHLLDAGWFARLTYRERVAVCTKLLRIHIFGVVLNRATDWWTDTERKNLATVTERILEAAPGVGGRLSIADNRLLTAIRSRSISHEEMLRRAHQRRRHGMPSTLVPANPVMLFAREAPLRFMVASFLTR